MVDTDIEVLLKKEVDQKKTIGLDVGIKDFLIRDDGQKYKNNRYLQKSLNKLARLQKWHSRKERLWREDEEETKRKVNSSHREKSRMKIARLHEKIANQRLDYIHKITHKLTHDSQVSTICVEDLCK